MDEVNALVIVGADMGKVLMDAANEQLRAELQKRAVGCVTDLMKAKSSTQALIDKWREQMAVIDLKLVAINQGEFGFDHHGKIVYKDSKLNDG
jgi:hypothetical protein